MTKRIAISLLLGSTCLLASGEASSDPMNPPSILLVRATPSHTLPLPALPDALPWLDGWPAVRSCELEKRAPHSEDFVTSPAKDKSVPGATMRGAAS